MNGDRVSNTAIASGENARVLGANAAISLRMHKVFCFTLSGDSQ